MHYNDELSVPEMLTNSQVVALTRGFTFSFSALFTA